MHMSGTVAIRAKNRSFFEEIVEEQPGSKK
jgi:hypothetical protein